MRPPNGLSGNRFHALHEKHCGEASGSCPVEWCNSGVAVVIAGEAGSIKLPPQRAA